jgi:ABC-2 type transport system permease protein
MFAAKLYAFLKRDLINAASYKFAFFSSFLGIFTSSATMFFVSKLIPGGGAGSFLESYGGDYFSFVIIGIAFSGFFGILQGGLPGIIRNAQVTGTLEALLVTQTSIPTLLIGSSLYSFFYTMLTTIFHLGLAILVFGMKLGHINWIGGLLTFFLTSLCFLSIGILSSSFIMVYKMGNPFTWIFGSVSGLLGGVMFPITILPGWIRWVSYILPITHSLEGMRRSLLSSSTLSEILPSVMALGIFAAILFPLSLAVFRLAVKKAKRDGTLIHY